MIIAFPIKHHQGLNPPQRQPVTANRMCVIHRSLNLQDQDRNMLWAACCLGFFGFLWAGEFTVNSSFHPSIHLTVLDLQVDVELNPSSLRIHIKSSKTDPFQQGCFLYLGHVWTLFAQSLQSWFINVLPLGSTQGTPFTDRAGHPFSQSRLLPFS